MRDPLLEVDAEKDNFIDQIKDMQERIAELERFALTSQNVKANKIGIGNADMSDIASGDIATLPWTPYQDDSIIVGWTSWTTKQINYKKIGRIVFVQFELDGVSNSVNTTFTIPYDSGGSANYILPVLVRDDSGARAVGTLLLVTSSSIVEIYSSLDFGSWNPSNTKEARGEFWFETD